MLAGPPTCASYTRLVPSTAARHADRPSLTKIVATLGPASDGAGALDRMIEAGVSVFRFNFSHGEFAEHDRRLRELRLASRRVGRPVAALGDLCGPKIRIGKYEGAPATASEGRDILLVPSREAVAAPGAQTPVLPCTYDAIADEVKPGHRVLINDGAVRALAVERMETNGKWALRCRVTVGGPVAQGKGINLPDTDIALPAVTEFDRACAKWAVERDMDFLALSFVRSAADVSALRVLLAACRADAQNTHDPGEACALGEQMLIIAKIEKPQALERIDEILGVADGVMVARGDLGVELDVARVPLAQKRLVARANEFGRPCIVATQMLESMIESASPTRAEASDVANAILDGADAVMLSGETAVGKRPVLVVETMRRIASVVESEMRLSPRRHEAPRLLREARDVPAAISHGARTMCEDVGASLIVVWSEGGGTASRLSQNEFPVPVLAFSSDERAVRRMALLRGVTPVHCATPPQHRSEFAALADRYAVEHGWAKRGEKIVLIGGKPFGVRGTTNTVAIRTAGEFTEGDPA